MADSPRGWLKVIADAVDPGNPGMRNDNEPGYLERIAAGIEAASPGDVNAKISAALAANERTFSEYGGGAVDFTDTDYTNAITTPLPADTATQITRNLNASAANNRLNRPFTDWVPWDNTAKLVRARALYDVIGISIDMRIVPDKVGGVVRVSMMAGAVEVGAKNMPLTVQPGTEEKIRVDFPQIFVRNSFATNGARLMLTPTVPMTLVEFSPEFYPLGYEA